MPFRVLPTFAAILFLFLSHPLQAGAEIIFSSYASATESQLISINPDTRVETPLTVSPVSEEPVVHKELVPNKPPQPPRLLSIRNVFPAISKDKKYIAFASFRQYEDEGLKLWKLVPDEKATATASNINTSPNTSPVPKAKPKPRTVNSWDGRPLYPEEFYLYFYSYFQVRTSFTRNKNLNWNIYMLDLNTKKEAKIANFLFDEIEPQFMPRGSEVLYTLVAEKSLYILKGDKTGKSWQQITMTPDQATHAQISPDGKTLLYQSFRNSTWDLYTMNMSDRVRERVEKRLTATSNVDEFFPRWSPDEKTIIYIANEKGNSFFDLMTMDIKSGKKNRITKKMNVSPDASWSPNPTGARIAYTASPKRERELHIINSDGKGDKKITIKTGDAYYPTWSPDGSKIAFLLGIKEKGKDGKIRTNYYLNVADAAKGSVKQISQTPCTLSNLVWY